MNVDRGRNYYSCGGFRHLARNCKNRRIVGRGKRLEYRGNRNNKQTRMIENRNGQENNLNGNRDLIILN